MIFTHLIFFKFRDGASIPGSIPAGTGTWRPTFRPRRS